MDCLSRGGISFMKSTINFLGLAAILTSCGVQQITDKHNDGSHAAIPIALSSGVTAADLLLQEEDLQLAGSNSGGLPVDSYVITVSGCATGETGTTSASILNVYIKDTNCIAKLTSFTLRGQAYTPSGAGAVAFTSWTVGSTAIFQGASATDLINVKVVSQLSSPVAVSDFVSYNITMNKAGTNNASIVVGESQSLYVAGQDSPNFIINTGDATFVNINSSGYGQFTFKMTCASGTMKVGSQTGKTTFCPTVTNGTYASGAGVDVYASSNSDATSFFSYKLILDPQNSGSPGTLTMAQAQAAFSTAGSTVALADFNPSNTAATAFTTVTLTGPGQMATEANRYMILVLQAKDTNASYTSNTSYSSFQYFPITLPAVNQ